jgi:hypothetical protein
MKAPPRLIDDASVAPELRADLERAASSEHAYDVAAGLATFQAAIGSAGELVPHAADAAASGQAAQAGTAAVTTKGALFGAAGAKVTLATVGVVAVVAVSVATLPRQEASKPAPVPPPTAAPAKPQPTFLPAAAEPSAAEQPAPVPGEVAAPALSGSVPPHRAGKGSKDQALRREIALVGEMKAALASDPARTYELSQQATRELGRGMLHEEREALATLALFQLGRSEPAARRARAFLDRYPKSALRERLEPIAQGP